MVKLVQKRKTVFFTVMTPIGVRNFFLIPQGVLDQLRARSDLRVVVLVTAQAYSQVKADFEGGNVIVESTPVFFKKSTIQRFADFFTKYLNLTGLMRFNATSIGSRIDIKPHKVSFSKKYFSFLKIAIARTFGRSRWARNILAPKLSLFAYRQRPYRHLFEKYQPHVVFVSNILGEQGLEILRESRRQGVHTVGVSESWDHFQKRYEPIKPDTLLVWHEASKKEAEELQDYKKDRIFVVGASQYDVFAKKELLLSRSEFFRRCGLDSSKRLISFFSSTVYSPDDGDIVAILLDFIRKRELSAPAQIFVRPYPGVKFDHQKFDRFNSERDIYVDWLEIQKIWGTASHGWYPQMDAYLWLASIFYHSDIVINTYSSAAIEASAFLKPIININFDGYTQRPFEMSVKRFEDSLSHYRHVLVTGGVVQANSAEELLSHINRFFANPDANRAHIERLRDKMCGKIDGKASSRIVEHILRKL
jgi:hypothetical protein